MRILAVAILAIAIAGTSTSPVAATQATQQCPRYDAVDSALLMRDVFRLSHDSMQGRRVGTAGNAMARAMIAARFDSLKLEVVGKSRTPGFSGRGGATQGANVIGMIRGTRFPNRYIVISAHYDHIGFTQLVRDTTAGRGRGGGGGCRAIGADTVCNGADDDASGTSGVMNLAQYFMRNKPAHSIIFAAFDSEESGLAGSRAWVDSLPVPVDSVLLNVNMDMVGRNEKNELYASGTNRYPHLTPMVEAAMACAPRPVKLLRGHDGVAPHTGRDDWTSASDHGSFHRRGIPFIYFGEEDHPDYHQAGDHADRLMPAFYVGAVRIVGDFVKRFDANPMVKPR
jgi:Zn-dependent M28 family amino/carboxypeptidase